MFAVKNRIIDIPGNFENKILNINVNALRRKIWNMCPIVNELMRGVGGPEINDENDSMEL